MVLFLLITCCAHKGTYEGLIIAGFLSGGTPNPPDKLGSKTLHKASQLW